MFYTKTPKKDPAIHDGFKQDEVRDVIEKQRKAVRKARRESKRLPQVLFIVDDLADDKRTMGCQLIRELMLRGRHSWISTILSTQKNRNINTAVDSNLQLCSVPNAILERFGNDYGRIYSGHRTQNPAVHV